MFSAPSDLITFARRKGLRAEEYNDNSLQQLEDLVTQGIPVVHFSEDVRDMEEVFMRATKGIVS